MPQERRSRAADSPAAPTFTTTGTHHGTDHIQSILHRPEDGYAAPSPSDLREARLRAELEALGYGITVPCQVCKHPLTTAKSVARHIGPKCAAKVAARAVGR